MFLSAMFHCQENHHINNHWPHLRNSNVFVQIQWRRDICLKESQVCCVSFFVLFACVCVCVCVCECVCVCVCVCECVCVCVCECVCVCMCVWVCVCVCVCVLYYCHRVDTQLQLTNISYHIKPEVYSRECLVRTSAWALNHYNEGLL
jgi:hypothetical protein